MSFQVSVLESGITGQQIVIKFSHPKEKTFGIMTPF